MKVPVPHPPLTNLPCAARVAVGLGLALGSSGCVRVYQPMSGLHQPVVVDPTVPNFEGVRLTVYCVPAELLNLQEASSLCQKVGNLFENQGAMVVTTVGGPPDDLDDEEAEQASAATSELTLELRAREVHRSGHPVSWLLNIASVTLVPGVTEATFAQDVVVRDGEGFMLASESLEGRLITRFGAGTWVGNKLLDVLWRGDEDDLTGEVAQRDLSSDLYRQLSQVVYNAKVQQDVLAEAAATRGAPW